MSERSTHHATFVVERTYAAAPARVFAAWAKPEQKASWMGCHDDWGTPKFELDFRVGGWERHRIGPPGGPVHAFDGLYHDIVPDRRIVYSYDMHLGETRISVSLATVEFKPAGTGTRLVFTEQAAFLDGYENVAEREEGTRVGLERLDEALWREPASA